ncbi:M23 family metallopeptidase [Effusibacillus lacus]|uniref:Peptidase M23 n=1 Tax=Effusibacillus lacus TaxID=1348429 RepID=A0A292YNZ6_9BACL|nr:M23 family metallopeptidase [Effusibacillus lacus]TCS70634.1 peptidase M23-like protein [Effusibacillus lacus]GAX90631.1 peptidase M23 [Effusibacillus lacus]
MNRATALLLTIGMMVLMVIATPVRANDLAGPAPQTDPTAKFKKAAAKTQIPWFYLAAIYQYESNLQWRKKAAAGETVVELPAPLWCGSLNPNQQDRFEGTIRVYGGIGRDGNRDGIADPKKEEDVLYALATFLRSNGNTEDDIRITLWNHYHESMIVDRITSYARIYNHFGTTNLQGNAFPIPKRYNYTYRSTWGDRRGWGGRRIHEGTDIFAGYGTPVVATTYGYVELKGWNDYGGWRIGIRDLNNIYHYYAHLSSYAKGIQLRNIVTPGQVIGYVGSSGYGKPGTSGKFAPHLHYGMYRDTGTTEFAFDPTPYLRRWERQSRKK